MERGSGLFEPAGQRRDRELHQPEHQRGLVGTRSGVVGVKPLDRTDLNKLEF
jgi:hypothetical protein